LGVGLHFEADLTFDERCGDVHKVLSQVLRVKDPALHLYCGLGLEGSWHESLHLSSFTLEGAFQEIAVPTPCPGVTLTSIGVRLLGFETVSYNRGGLSLDKEYGFAVFGSMDLKADSWKTSAELDFEISKTSSVIRLSAEAMCNWECAFNVPNLTVGVLAYLLNIALRDSFVAS
jgi:hypothetical protein